MNKINNDFNNNIDRYKKIESKPMDPKSLELKLENLKAGSIISDEFISSLDSKLIDFLSNIDKNIEILDEVVISFNLNLEKQNELKDSLEFILKDLHLINQSIYDKSTNKTEIVSRIEKLISFIEIQSKESSEYPGDEKLKNSYKSILRELKDSLGELSLLEDEDFRNIVSSLTIEEDLGAEIDLDLNKLVNNQAENEIEEGIDQGIPKSKNQMDKKDESMLNKNKEVESFGKIEKLEGNMKRDKIEFKLNEVIIENDKMPLKAKNSLLKLEQMELKLALILDETIGNRDKINLEKYEILDKLNYINDLKLGDIKDLDLEKLLGIINFINEYEENKKIEIKHKTSKDLNPNIVASIVQSLNYSKIEILGKQVKIKNILYISLVFIVIFILIVITN